MAHLSMDDLRTMMWPMGAEDRCCLVCGQSATNPILLETQPHLFQAHARATVKCLRFGQMMLVRQTCGEFIHRDDFPGWPQLPPSIHPADRWRDVPGPLFVGLKP